MKMDDFRVIATEGYNDGYYWDYRIWFEYGNNSYTYIDYGSCSGYIPCHEAITKNVMDLLEGDRDPRFSANVSIDKEKLINYAERLNASGEYELSF